jgi:hypothetical protein
MCTNGRGHPPVRSLVLVDPADVGFIEEFLMIQRREEIASGRIPLEDFTASDWELFWNFAAEATDPSWVERELVGADRRDMTNGDLLADAEECLLSIVDREALEDPESLDLLPIPASLDEVLRTMAVV